MGTLMTSPGMIFVDRTLTVDEGDYKVRDADPSEDHLTPAGTRARRYGAWHAGSRDHGSSPE